jgi:lipoate-protein ligase A
MNWRLLDSGPNIGAYNMAVDEELLARAQAGETTPMLRLYTWRPPAVSLGRFQKLGAAVNAEACRRRGIDIVRRITGGRAVLHNKELTYSIITRTDNPLFPANVHGAYKIIAAGLLQGLGNLGIPAEMVSRSSRHAVLVKKDPKDAACFSTPSWYELLVHDRKIVGSAQRRLSGAFLQHGSVLLDYDPALEAEVIPGGGRADVVTSIARELGRDVPLAEVKQAFVKGFSEALGIVFHQ